MSQPKQPTSTPSVPASTVKPAQHEKGAASSSTRVAAAKPATTAASAATTTTGTRSTSTVTNVGASTGAKASGGVTTTTGSSKVTLQAPPVSPAIAPPVSTGTTGAVGGAGKPPTELVKPTDTSKVQKTAVSSSKLEPSKVTSTVTKPTATTVVSGTTGQKEDVKSKEAKVKSEVSPKASTLAPAVDPLDALAGSLPSEKPSKSPQFTGPEVTEPSITSEVAHRCGDGDATLPPGYRLKDMEKKMPAGEPEKPKEVSKPLTLDEAVDSLSTGFVSTPLPSKPEVKHETVAAVDTRKNYAPAPPAQKKQDASVPASLSPAPPADKKPKIEKPATDSAAAQDVKPKIEEKKVSADKPKQDPKADPMSVDALEALVGTLPEAKPVPESPELRPEEIVHEGKLKSEKGVRVGERDDTLPPEYRFKEDKDKKLPPPPKQPSMDTTEALDILSGGFTDASVAPAVHSPVKAQVKQPQVEDLSALDALAGDFVAPAHARKVCSGAPSVPTTATKSTPPTSDQADPMSLDALDALGGTLPEAKLVPESPKVRPEEIVKEAEIKSEKGVRVGERDDTLPPGYRFPKEDPKTQPPPPKKEPSLDPTEALDILSGDFTSSSAAPVVHAPVPPSAPPADSSADFDLEEFALDFVAPTSASKVCSAASAPTTTDRQADPMSLDALDALGGTLPEAKLVPESPKLRPEEIIKEAEIKSEKGVRVGERDDTLPPGYRFPKEDPKTQPPPPKKEPSLDPTEALDILSGDFTSSAKAPVVQTPVPPSAPPADSSADFDLGEFAVDLVAPTSASKVCSAASAPTTMDRQLSEGTTSAMDALSDTLKDIRPAPEPEPVPPKHVVEEKKVVEERVSKPGERDDSLPPECRPKEADIKAAAEAKAKAASAAKQPSLDESQALDILSGSFVSEKPPVTPPAPQCQAPPANTSSSQKESGPVLDKLAASLLPGDFPDTKPSDSKRKGKGGKSKSAPKKPAEADVPVMEPLPPKPSTDVMSSSPTKKGGKS
ncbi:calpastatin isoform X7 [Pangasianodon hypophthalmus]|uniref:calpastatin isoform X7 n=1 Tax=Pangasianodon hypophthalmus TaxID=310915 RepID=UPI00230815DE|nr:calpastatin isoform X7 [Pangasianodon hypophthalmus]